MKEKGLSKEEIETLRHIKLEITKFNNVLICGVLFAFYVATLVFIYQGFLK